MGSKQPQPPPKKVEGGSNPPVPPPPPPKKFPEAPRPESAVRDELARVWQENETLRLMLETEQEVSKAFDDVVQRLKASIDSMRRNTPRDALLGANLRQQFARHRGLRVVEVAGTYYVQHAGNANGGYGTLDAALEALAKEKHDSDWVLILYRQLTSEEVSVVHAALCEGLSIQTVCQRLHKAKEKDDGK